jgi:membrane protease YdiL (CAAX protease family)
MQDERSIVNGWARSVPWTGSEVLLSVFLVWFFWPALAQVTLQGIGFYRWYYGPELVAVAQSEDSDPIEKTEAQSRLALWPTALASPFQVLTFPILLAALSGTRPEQLGLTARRFGRNLLLGVGGMLVLTPLAFGIYWIVRYLYAESGGAGVEKHALEIVAQQHPFPSEWVVLVLTATVAAPVREELTFRGVLQPWLAARRWGGHVAMVGALGLAVLYQREHLIAGWQEGIAPLTTAAMPALFVLGLVPVYLLVWWRSQTPRGPAIFGASLLFACVHTSVWPTPVPLFVLALGLGILADRTRSLVGPIVLHGLFNGVSCVLLLLAQ